MSETTDLRFEHIKMFDTANSKSGSLGRLTSLGNLNDKIIENNLHKIIDTTNESFMHQSQILMQQSQEFPNVFPQTSMMQQRIEQMLNSEPRINFNNGKFKSLENWRSLGPLSIDFLQANIS